MLADKPQFVCITGPSGGGKSRWFKELPIDSFNIDDRASVLNGGSYITISSTDRDKAFQELQSYADMHFSEGRSFATESTLRSLWVLPMAERAYLAGFDVRCTFIAAESWETHVERVMKRGLRGGHSAPEAVIRDIYSQSLSNLPLLFDASARGLIHSLTIYDNSLASPRLILELQRGFIDYLSAEVPAWLETALDGTSYSMPTLRQAAGRHDRVDSR